MAGFYGKLPAKGDFLSRSLPREFVDVWDDLLQTGMNDSRQALGEAWLQIYLTSPLWRFVLPAGICGKSGWAGVLMPSMDKVGRYFPMTVVAPLASPVMPTIIAKNCDSWFAAVENSLLEALDNESLDVDEFDQSLQNFLLDDDPVKLQDITSSLDQGVRAPLNDDPDVSAALLNITNGMLGDTLSSCSMWWSQGSERVSPSLVFCRGLPGPGQYTALLDGNWTGHGWDDCSGSANGDAIIVDDIVAV